MDDSQLATDLVADIDKTMKTYKRWRYFYKGLQWSVLLAVTIAGFFTTTAGTVVDLPPEVAEPWYARSHFLITWGLIAALGSVIVQQASPAQQSEVFEKKRDTLRHIRSAVVYWDLDAKVASNLIEMALNDPAQASTDLVTALAEIEPRKRRSPG